jgi:DNA primase
VPNLARTLLEKAGTSEAFVKVLSYFDLLNGGEVRYKVICPFHEDVNASMLIDIERASWFCFGCQKGGSAFDLIKSFQPDKTAIQNWQLLFRITNGQDITPPEFKFQVKSAKDLKAEKHQLFIEAQDYYFNLSKVDWKNTYNEEAIYLHKRGFNSNTLTRVGAKLTYNVNYPIIFPMNDMGRFSGWVCRTTDPEVEKRRKYLYNKGFSRRNTIVGNYAAETVILVEGFMDYLKVKQFGIVHVGALLGWKATDSQIEKLKAKGVKLIISALDNDKCGHDGSDYLAKYFNIVRFQFPPGIKDPGDMDAETFKRARSETKALRRRIHGIT